jgi:hypothetical protein
MPKKPGGMTLDEFEAALKAEGKWDAFVAQQEERDRLVAERSAEYRRAEAPLVQDLRAAGLRLNSVWDLVNTTARYPRALPILVEHLQRPYPDAIRDGIARALAVREARFAWRTLVEQYQKEPEGRAKQGLAAAISATASDEVMDELIGLARNKQLGETRGFFLRPLCRSSLPQAQAALAELSSDPDLEKEIRFLRHLRDKRKRTEQ